MNSIATANSAEAPGNARIRQAPVVWIDGRTGSPATAASAAFAEQLGWQTWAPAGGCGQALGDALQEFRREFPDRSLLRLSARTILQPDDALKLIQALYAGGPAPGESAVSTQARVISCLSNRAAWSNPFAGLNLAGWIAAQPAPMDPPGTGSGQCLAEPDPAPQRPTPGAATQTASAEHLPDDIADDNGGDIGDEPGADAGGDTDTGAAGLARIASALVGMLGTGHLFPAADWPRHLQLFSVPALGVLAQPGLRAEHAATALRQAGGELLLTDRVFALDPAQPAHHAFALRADEERQPPAFGTLVERVTDWLASQAPLPDFALLPDQPVTLHITHSWGGGVARWVEAFVDGAGPGQQLQLRSEGPQPGAGAGQRLSLYAGNELGAPIARWWLAPTIRSCGAHHPQYQAILADIARRHGIGRVIVSSLVGHSLDALRSGLPTVQVLHDFFPLWPLLGVHPGPFLDQPPHQRLVQATREHQLLPDFRELNPDQWHGLAQRWRESLVQAQVRLVAPSHSTAALLRQLDPDWQEIPIEIIHHGLPPLSPGSSGAGGSPADCAPVPPRPRSDGRLRLVVPGRMQQGKGRDLLLAAVPRLTELAQLYLVGAGKDAEAFFGCPGVNIVLQYRRDQLAGILRTIGPDAALLLSVVPETFSYTLSEMQQLGIPVVATRVGSLAERVHDDDGWLIEPRADALVERVRELAANRGALQQVRVRLSDIQPFSMDAMIGAYERLCPLAAVAAAGETAVDAAGSTADAAAHGLHAGLETALELPSQLGAAQAQSAWLRVARRALAARVDALQAEVDKRTDWARELEKTLLAEVDKRTDWARALEKSLQAEQAQLAAANESLRHTQHLLERETSARRDIEEVHRTVLQSSSWRLTRPLRVARRMLANLRRARAGNPLRWPLLLSQGVRMLTTQGLRGALLRAQTTAAQGQPPGAVDGITAPELALAEPPADVPCPDEPQVSVIIPVFNKWAYTAACLQSLVSATNDTSFEVIVVDDHSTDETAVELEQIRGLNAIRNPRNRGFVISCNRGLEAARGEYVVLLNNDTQVLDGWLDALLDTFRNFPDTGLAGARLLYPDGSLQEAGGMIFNDGSGWNYGRGDRAERPEYNFVREVDYCSGACIMLPTALMRDCGGFDMLYAPAYYEDTDLAFKVRQAGLKVRVQPAATVIHHEGISSGTDPASGAKRYQEINRAKFRERWGEVLAGYPAPIADPDEASGVRRARDHRQRGRVLVIDAYTPEPDQDSGSVRLTYLFQCLQQLGYGVTFFADNRAYAGRYSAALQQAGVEVVYNPWLASMEDFFRDRGADFDFVIISRHYVAANYLSLLRRYCPSAKFIFDTVDLHYLREQRLAELENSLPLRRVAAQTRRSELAVVRAADATLVVSSVEREVLAEDAPQSRVHLLSNIHRVQPGKKGFAERRDIFFVGGYQHPPNIDAASWFVHSIWPLIRRQLPGVNFHLIGSKAPEAVRSLGGEGVVFHGFVENLDPWLDGCRMAIAPLRYGAGVKGKVNLSMSRGQPVVATPAAVEGLQATDGEDVLIATTAEEFAAAVVRLYRDETLWNRLAANGLENVHQHFSMDTARASLEQLFRDLGRP